MTILEIIKRYLIETKADGLTLPGVCSCKVDNLSPCESISIECVPGVFTDCDHCSDNEFCDKVKRCLKPIK